MNKSRVARSAVAFAVGAVLPHAVDAMLRSGVLPAAWPGLSQTLAWSGVGLPAAWLTARVVAPDARSGALAAAAGGLLALAVPFLVYELPLGVGVARLLWLQLTLLCVVWPAVILLIARRR